MPKPGISTASKRAKKVKEEAIPDDSQRNPKVEVENDFQSELLHAAKEIRLVIGDVAKELTMLRQALLTAAAGVKAGPAREREPYQQAAPKAEAPAQPKASPPPAPPKGEPAEPVVTSDDVKRAVLAYAETHGREAILAVFARFGVARAGELSPAAYPAFLKALEE